MTDEHLGHRKRLDEKSYLTGFENLEEHEQLEKFLFAVLRRGNTNELAHRLLREFGGLYGVLTASVADLEKVDGVGHRIAEVLHDIYAFMCSAERSRLRAAKGVHIFRTIDDMGNYAKTLFYDEMIESMWLISLNNRYVAYRNNKLYRGNNNETHVYIPEIVKVALRNDAKSVVIAHNHPSGDLTPSQADIDVTIDLFKALKTVEIDLIDHIIVGGGDYVSLRKLGVF